MPALRSDLGPGSKCLSNDAETASPGDFERYTNYGAISRIGLLGFNARSAAS
jgi:hypothetical protein